jgi:hypothetical protein
MYKEGYGTKGRFCLDSTLRYFQGMTYHGWDQPGRFGRLGKRMAIRSKVLRKIGPLHITLKVRHGVF